MPALTVFCQGNQSLFLFINSTIILIILDLRNLVQNYFFEANYTFELIPSFQKFSFWNFLQIFAFVDCLLLRRFRSYFKVYGALVRSYSHCHNSGVSLQNINIFMFIQYARLMLEIHLFIYKTIYADTNVNRKAQRNP